MIPSAPRAGANKSEIALFSAFEAIVDKPDWVVIHSLVIGQNSLNLTGEADFLVMVPGRGIVVIESKAPTSVKYSNGEWTLAGTPKPNKNPLLQLDSAVRNIRSFLDRNELFSNMPLPRLVWFTSIGRHHMDVNTHGDMQFFEWELAWRDEMARPEKTIDRILDEHTKWHSSNETLHYDPAGLTPEMVTAITDQLLSSFEFVKSPTDRLVERKTVQRNALDEQVAYLELVETNDHIYFEGAAGTGKSFLLQEAARNFARKGYKTLVTCWNVMMAEETAGLVGGRPNVTVQDLNSLMLEICGLKTNPANADNNWYTVELPTRAIEFLRKKPELGNFEAICIDECQDIASNNLLLEFVFLLGKAKQPEGTKIILAGDMLQQSMVDGQAWVDPFKVAKREIPDIVNVRLKTNCRNAPNLGKHLESLTKLEIEVSRSRQPLDTEGGMQILRYGSNNQAKVLEGVIKELLVQFRPEDIRILSPFGSTSLIGEMMLRQAESSAERYLKGVLRFKTRPGIRWRSIAQFKGLESDVVVITDIDQRAKNFYEANGQTLGQALYVGATRARNWCILLVGDDVISLGNPAK
jgi:hypothetical protein